MQEEDNQNISFKENVFTDSFIKEQLRCAYSNLSKLKFLQKLCESTNVFLGILSHILACYLENGFPDSFIENLLHELNDKVIVKTREKFNSSYYTAIVYTSLQLDNLDNKHLRVLLMKLGDFLWKNLPRNKKDFSEQLLNAHDQSVTEKR